MYAGRFVETARRPFADTHAVAPVDSIGLFKSAAPGKPGSGAIAIPARRPICIRDLPPGRAFAPRRAQALDRCRWSGRN